MEIKSISLKNPEGITISKDAEILKERVARIIMTSPYERVNNPFFGTLLFNSFLFDLPNVLEQNLNFHLKNVIERYEPKVSVRDVDVNVSGDLATINVKMVIKETFEPLEFETVLTI